MTGPHAAAIRAALPDALVVESLEDALEVITRQGPVACVTLAGEAVRGGIVEGGRGVKGLLAPRREVKEVAVRLEEVESRLLDTREREREETGQADAAQVQARELEVRIHAAEMERVAIRHDRAAAEEEQARHSRKASVLDVERQQAEQERGAAAVQ